MTEELTEATPPPRRWFRCWRWVDGEVGVKMRRASFEDGDEAETETWVIAYCVEHADDVEGWLIEEVGGQLLDGELIRVSDAKHALEEILDTLPKVESEPKAPKTCSECGAPVVGRANNALICSDACAKNRTRASRPRAEPKASSPCEVCGEPIVGRVHNAKTCSEACAYERERRILWERYHSDLSVREAARQRMRERRAKLRATRRCEECGGAIPTKRSLHAKTCGDDCTQARERRESRVRQDKPEHRARNRERALEHYRRRCASMTPDELEEHRKKRRESAARLAAKRTPAEREAMNAKRRAARAAKRE